jgi:hypothetical protein
MGEALTTLSSNSMVYRRRKVTENKDVVNISDELIREAFEVDFLENGS